MLQLKELRAIDKGTILGTFAPSAVLPLSSLSSSSKLTTCQITIKGTANHRSNGAANSLRAAIRSSSTKVRADTTSQVNSMEQLHISTHTASALPSRGDADNFSAAKASLKASPNTEASTVWASSLKSMLSHIVNSF
jgi:hypothetical protein